MVNRRMQNGYNHSHNSNMRNISGSNNNMGCRNQGNSNKDCELMNKLRKVDFSLIDTILYLDAYPKCSEALSYYHKLLAQRKELVEKLSEMGMPVTSFSNVTDSWRWVDSPWPWEYEANV